MLEIRKSIVAVILIAVGLTASTANAFWGQGSETLAVVNDMTLTTDDFLHWWQEWKDSSDTPVPENSDEFINWMLLFQQAEQMRLFENPSYQKKVEVFLKARALMLLKSQEVDGRIQEPTEKQLWEMYQKNHTPIFRMRVLNLKDENAAQKVKSMTAGGLDLVQAAKKAGILSDDADIPAMGPVRAQKLSMEILQAVSDLKPGGVSEPVLWDATWRLLQLVERTEGSQEDFAALKESLRNEHYRQEANRLTRELLERLKAKYAIAIDRKVLEAITPDGVSEGYADKPAVTINKVYVDAANLYPAIQKEARLRKGRRQPDDADAFFKIRERVVNDIVSQTLTSMDALERHYEKQPPFKYTYEFYCQRRMIMELEKTLIRPEIKISDEDVKAFYEGHEDRYRPKGQLVEVGVVKTRDSKLAKHLDERLQSGEDFFEVMQPLVPRGIPVQRLSEDQLNPAIGRAVAGMSPGQTSRAIPDGDDIYFLKLIKRGESEATPLEKVSEEIRQEIFKERFKAERDNLLDKLKKRSSIEIRQKAWEKIKTRLLSEKVDENQS